MKKEEVQVGQKASNHVHQIQTKQDHASSANSMSMAVRMNEMMKGTSKPAAQNLQYIQHKIKQVI